MLLFILILLLKYDPKYGLTKSFQDVFNRIDNWISEGSGWIIESIHDEHVNISIYSPLSGNSYIELPNKLRNSKKGLINIKKIENKCFLWCHIRHLNPLKIHTERITKAYRKIVNDLDYVDIKFPVSNRDSRRIEKKNNICINVFYYENDLIYPVYASGKKFEDMQSDENYR